MAKNIIGLDVGGTKISVVLGNEKGKILDKRIIPTRYQEEAKACLDEVLATVDLVIFKNKLKDVVGIGVGLPGPVDPDKGFIGKPPNLPGWEGLKIKAMLKQKFRRPVFVNNDANCTALAEKRFGTARGVANFVYITVSTGIGSGIIIDGQLYSGANFNAGEIGHMTIMPGGAKCGCGKRGCLEAYASGTAIANQAKREIRKRVFTIISKICPDLAKVTAKEVEQAARQGDRVAIHIIKNAGHFLGIGLANLINLLNPQMIVVGGSIIKSGQLYWQPMLEAVRKEAWPSPLKACKILKTKLGEEAADLGTVALVLENLRR